MPVSSSNDASIDAVCSLPQVVGPCRAMLQRWFYDAASAKCLEFIYGGCQGNANNFESKADCEAKCLGGPLLLNPPINPLNPLDSNN